MKCFGDWDLIRVKDLSVFALLRVSLAPSVDCSIEPIKNEMGLTFFEIKHKPGVLNIDAAITCSLD